MVSVLSAVVTIVNLHLYSLFPIFCKFVGSEDLYYAILSVSYLVKLVFVMYDSSSFQLIHKYCFESGGDRWLTFGGLSFVSSHYMHNITSFFLHTWISISRSISLSGSRSDILPLVYQVIILFQYSCWLRHYYTISVYIRVVFLYGLFDGVLILFYPMYYTWYVLDMVIINPSP